MFRGLFDNMISGSAIYEVQNDGTEGADYIIRGFNKKSLEIEGKTIDQVLGKSLYELRPKIDEYGLIPVIKKVWETGIPANFPSKIYVDERFSNYYENHIFRLPTGEIVTIYNDVTEQKNTEIALKEREEKYRLITENATDVIWVLDPESQKFKYISPSAERILGLTEKERKNRSLAHTVTQTSLDYIQRTTPIRIERMLQGDSLPTRCIF